MLNRSFVLVLILQVIVLCGCSRLNNNISRLDEKPLKQELQARHIYAEKNIDVSPISQINEPNGVVTLPDTVAFALMSNPRLKAFSFEIRAAEGRKLQSSYLPNPEIEIEIEEFGGTGERARFGSSETAIQVGQLIELAGKRSKRMHLATLEKDVVELEYQSQRLDVIIEVAKRFIDVLAAQEQLNLTKELVDLSEQAYSAVAQKVDAGKESPVDQTKAKITLSNTRIEFENANKTLISARYQLAATWGSQNPGFVRVEGNFYDVSSIPSLEELTSLISQNPDVARWMVEKDKRRAALDLEKAKATSDIRLGGGFQYFNEGDDAAFILGLSIPVPLFNKNQGNIDEAMYMLAKTEEERKDFEAKTLAALAEAISNLSSSFGEATILKSEVLTSAQNAFEAVRQGYDEGKFEYLEVLDAQRTLFEVREKYIEAMARYHKTRADVERLIGQDLNNIKNALETGTI